MRRAAAWLALVVAVVALIWTVYLVQFGGFDARILGVKITTHQPINTLLVAIAAFGGFLAAHGVRRPRDLGRALAEHGSDRGLVWVLAGTTTVVGLLFSTMAATGSDSYGYVSEAELWLRGDLATPQPWTKGMPWPQADKTFAPLGYHAQSEYEHAHDGSAIVPTYSPGLPLLMAAAKRLAGHCALYAIVPLSGGVLVLATFGLGRRFGSSRLGLIAAWLVATSPVFLYMLMWPMTDVPVSAAWAVAFYLVLGGSVPSAIGAGLAVSAAILIRPNLAGMSGLLALWLLYTVWRDGPARRANRLTQLGGFLAAVAPGVIAVAAIYAHYYGSPLQSGYAEQAGDFQRANFLPNFRNYPVWFIDAQTPIALAGVAAILLPIRRLWTAVPDRAMVVLGAIFVLAVWIEYCFYLVFDVWWYLRFVLPGFPFIMLGLAAVAMAFARLPWPPVRVLVAAGIIALGLRGVALARERSAFELWQGEYRYVTVARLVQGHTDPNSVILSMQHSGSLRYYAGRETMRFDALMANWLDRAVEWLTAHGAHPYLLAEDWEIEQFRKMFAAQATIAKLDQPPVFVYSGPSRILFYDLARPGGANAPVQTVLETYRGPRCVEPAPPPTLVLKR